MGVLCSQQWHTNHMGVLSSLQWHTIHGCTEFTMQGIYLVTRPSIIQILFHGSLCIHVISMSDHMVYKSHWKEILQNSTSIKRSEYISNLQLPFWIDSMTQTSLHTCTLVCQCHVLCTLKRKMYTCSSIYVAFMRFRQLWRINSFLFFCGITWRYHS